MIHVFRTSVESTEHIEQIGPHLNAHLSEGAEWNFDLDDCDRILRVANGGSETVHRCTHVLRSNGFTCEELSE